jgi:two-component system, NtrC family, nitrogen regulation response regulator GlnG
VLSDGNFYRVGGHDAIKTNVRVIAATHQDLEQRVKEGVFREDLFHRLNVIRLRLPPLRERREDIPGLTRHFLQQSARQLEVEPKRISELALAQLSRFAFPGNVRQLENICHWLTVMAPAQVIDAKDLPPEVLGTTGAGLMAEPAAGQPSGDADMSHRMAGSASAGAPPVTSATPSQPFETAPSDQAAWESGVEIEAGQMLAAGRQDVWEVLTRRFESRLILTALANTRGRRIEAAQKLGIGRNTITRKIQDLGLE